MSDLGANVIKIEPLQGDAMRGMFRPARSQTREGTIDAGFHVDNRGKRSVAIAIDKPEGAELVKRLVAGADVFVTNLTPERQARFGLSVANIQELNDHIVHATLSGYGPVGPDADRAGFDVTAFFGRGAVIESMTDQGQDAPYSRPGQGDHITGLSLLAAVLSALRLVEKTGIGQVVNVSLFGTSAWTMATDLSSVLVDGREPMKRDRRHVTSAIANRYRCSDGRWILLNMPDAQWWQRFCVALANQALSDDPRFQSSKDRYDHMPELVDTVSEILLQKTLPQWMKIFDRAGLIVAPAASLTELADDPQARANDMFPTIDVVDETIRTVAVPFKIQDAQVAPRGPGPAIGQHTSQVLQSVGVSPEEIERLAGEKIIFDAADAAE
jgi:crotonobetainyl-CoA:carnitine CoA-transferase CaiB-like acyl-CoA transferase